MKRIRVLQLISGIAIGDHSGGAEQFAARLAIGLPGDRFDRAVFAMWQYGSPTEDIWRRKLEDAGVQIAGMIHPSGQLWPDLYRAGQILWSFTSKFQPHIINSHSERGDTLNALLRVFHRTSPLAVRTMHTDQQWQERPWAGRLLTFGVFPLLFKREIAISEQTRTVMDRRPLARLIHKSATLCYNGIDEALFDYQAPGLIPDLPPDRPRVVIVGRLAQQKGHRDLLQAFVHIHHMSGAHLLIIGSGPLEADLRSQAKDLNLNQVVHFLGSRTDVPALLATADLLVSASLWEGFPTVILEAMALGIPVVATEVSGSRELIRSGETGLLAPPGQPDALSEAVLALLADKATADRMARAAHERARRFTIQNTIATYAELYETLCMHQREK